MKNPFVENRWSVLTYLGAWCLISINHLLVLYFLIGINLNNALYDSVVYNGIFMLLALSLWYPSLYLSLDKNKVWKTLGNHLAGGIITSLIWIYAGYFILTNLIDEPGYNDFIEKSLIWRFNVGIIFYLITVVFYYVAFYYKGFREKASREAELKSLIKDSELKSLKYQLNPHFVFNSLNSISSLTISNPEKAREMTIKLSSFLRKTLSYNDKQMTPLKYEIENSRLYMDIERIRFGDNLGFEEELSDDCRKIEIPSMLLQPLFENAIKHGVYESTEKINIRLSCLRENHYLKITLQNNFDPEGVSRKGEGIGLKNIKDRLKLIYNQDNLITFDKLENLFTVNIYIPFD
jgi:hypothetical protein